MMVKEGFDPRKLIVPGFLTAAFWIIAFIIWQITGKVFFFFNFAYIGTSIGAGMGLFMALPRRQRVWGRKLAQLMVGLYLFIYIGLLLKENMQIEGFFFYILMGVFSGSTIHYLVAKAAGPLLFGRGWCGWACWTAMILDFLPFPVQKEGRPAGKWGTLRYLSFAISLTSVLALWFGRGYRADGPNAGYYWMIGGNLVYYALAFAAAFLLKDNRAFCKYICPIPSIQKILSRFSLMKVAGKLEGCNNCGACARQCPMNIDIPKYTLAGKRVLSTECISCFACVNTCPKRNLSVSLGFDCGLTEWIKYQPVHPSKGEI